MATIVPRRPERERTGIAALNSFTDQLLGQMEKNKNRREMASAIQALGGDFTSEEEARKLSSIAGTKDGMKAISDLFSKRSYQDAINKEQEPQEQEGMQQEGMQQQGQQQGMEEEPATLPGKQKQYNEDAMRAQEEQDLKEQEKEAKKQAREEALKSGDFDTAYELTEVEKYISPSTTYATVEEYVQSSKEYQKESKEAQRLRQLASRSPDPQRAKDLREEAKVHDENANKIRENLGKTYETDRKIQVKRGETHQKELEKYSQQDSDAAKVRDKLEEAQDLSSRIPAPDAKQNLQGALGKGGIFNNLMSNLVKIPGFGSVNSFQQLASQVVGGQIKGSAVSEIMDALSKALGKVDTDSEDFNRLTTLMSDLTKTSQSLLNSGYSEEQKREFMGSLLSSFDTDPTMRTGFNMIGEMALAESLPHVAQQMVLKKYDGAIPKDFTRQWKKELKDLKKRHLGNIIEKQRARTEEVMRGRREATEARDTRDRQRTSGIESGAAQGLGDFVNAPNIQRARAQEGLPLDRGTLQNDSQPFNANSMRALQQFQQGTPAPQQNAIPGNVNQLTAGSNARYRRNRGATNQRDIDNPMGLNTLENLIGLRRGM